MYGYIRPDRGELKVREYQQFRAAYCGLCEALRRRCGLLSRFVVNYDLTFLAMALSKGMGGWKRGAARRIHCESGPAYAGTRLWGWRRITV